MILKEASVADAPTWRETAARKRQENLEKIPGQWRLSEDVIRRAAKARDISDKFIDGLLDSETARITNLELPALMKMTGRGSLTAVKLVTAFCQRAAYGHQLNSNLLEINFEGALGRAKVLDRFWRENGKPMGPLHGLPLTLKDQYHVKGMGTTMAYVGWIDTFEGEKSSPLIGCVESQIVRELESLGAVIIAKAPETNNNILGYNLNPRNQELTSGGSSGGGSVSIPAAFNGVYSIKPSVGRLSFLRVATPSPSQTTIPAVPGLLGHSVESLEYLFRALVQAEPWRRDDTVVRIPWREYEYGDDDNNINADDDDDNSSSKPETRDRDGQKKRKLSFGYMPFDGVVRPHPPIRRALATAARALEAQGHELIPWDPPPHAKALEIHGRIATSDGCRTFFENLGLSGEPLIPELAGGFPGGRPLRPLDPAELAAAAAEMREYRAAYAAYWDSTRGRTSTGRPVDAIVLPVWPSAAARPGGPEYGGYIGFANVVDHSTMVIPVTTADKAVDEIDAGYEPVGEKDREMWESYDPDLFHGAPAAIQLQCRTLEEEKLLGIGKEVVRALCDLDLDLERKGKSKSSATAAAVPEYVEYVAKLFSQLRRMYSPAPNDGHVADGLFSSSSSSYLRKRRESEKEREKEKESGDLRRSEA
ncbi:amidase signature domain-containing protein [Biscogniauxia mediterranea]|nr:amidase signature domain-containing protein [Biscogniauxia mediterranea]